MSSKCPVDHLAADLEHLLLQLSDGKHLNSAQDKKLRSLLDEWWGTDCELSCDAKFCAFQLPIGWVAHHGYRNLYDLIDHFEYEDVTELRLKDQKSMDVLKASWARRPGHYDP